MTRWYGNIISLLLIAAVLSPLQADPKLDSYPLSSFAMFTTKRPPVVEIVHAVGFAKDGGTRPIPPRLVAGAEVLQAKVMLQQTVRKGRRASRKLCAKIAKRVGGDSGHAWVERIEVRSDRYQVMSYFSSARKPIRSRVHAKCEVPR